MTRRLAGQVALVTCGAHGVGAQIAQRLARAGLHIAISYGGPPEEADAVAHALERHGVQGAPFKQERCEPGAFAQLARTVAARFGQLDVLVDSTGRWPAEDDPGPGEQARPACEAVSFLSEGGRIIRVGPVQAADPRSMGPTGFRVALTARSVTAAAGPAWLGDLTRRVPPEEMADAVASLAASRGRPVVRAAAQGVRPSWRQVPPSFEAAAPS